MTLTSVFVKDFDDGSVWAVIELAARYNSQKIAGRYRHQYGLHCVDVPETGEGAGPDEFRFTRMYGDDAIATITPVDEMSARVAARALNIPAASTFEYDAQISRLAAQRVAQVDDFDPDFNYFDEEIF